MFIARQWIRKLWYLYTMEYYSATKRNTFESVLLRRMNLEHIIQSEVSQREKDKWRRQWQPTPVHLPGKSYGRRNLVGCSSGGCKELDTAEQLHFHFQGLCTHFRGGSPYSALASFCYLLRHPSGARLSFSRQNRNLEFLVKLSYFLNMKAKSDCTFV